MEKEGSGREKRGGNGAGFLFKKNLPEVI